MSATRPAPGLMIAAPRSGSGKTLLTLGLMRAFTRRGLRVGSAKCGPDYIDGAFHAAAAGTESVNLDSWAMSPTLIDALGRGAGAEPDGRPRDLVICEGSMGLFDGVPNVPGRTGASADIAAALGWPVVLCLDVSGQAQSAAAVAKGCSVYDPRISIAGVILNRVASERHRRLAAGAIEAAGLRVLGVLPRGADIGLPERHLGLVQAEETAGLEALLDRIADFVAAHCDLDAIRAAAGGAPLEAGAADEAAVPPPGQRIAVARDVAFSFIYPHLLQGWRRRGAEIVFFSPLAGEAPPPDCDFCWLPGGYPELHAARLAAARNFFEGLAAFAQTHGVHGECGGYMVLGRTLTDAAGTPHRRAGLLSPDFSFATRKLHLGYRNATLVSAHLLGPAGARLRGHEFHYATASESGAPDAPFALVEDAHGGEARAEGSRRDRVSGGFFHVMAAG